MIKFLPLDILRVSQSIPWKNKTKLSMYADDLTAFIYDQCSASHLFNL